MDNAKDLQRQHEKAICNELIKLVLPTASFVRMGNDKGEPDVIYQSDHETIGVELGTAYYDNSDAKQEWTLARGEREFPSSGYEPRHGGVIVSPDNLICSKIQQEIDDKCRKNYSNTDKAWLCVEARSPLSDDESFKQCTEKLLIPQNHNFGKIWLFYAAPSHNGGGYRAVNLYE